MPIINTTPPPTLTPDQRMADFLQQRIAKLYAELQVVFGQCESFVWKNPAMKPQEVFDLFGANAADLCRISSACATGRFATAGSLTRMT